LNADMVGRGDAGDIPGGGPNYVQVVGSRKLSTELGDLVDRVNKEGGHNFAFDYVTGDQYYTRSDHYMYARFGIPIAFFITGVHPDYHQVTDEPEYIDYEKMARIASLISDIAVHVANLDHRLVVDHH
jgi:Zn-dependent M28 family amino/carboxypeptidase